VRGSTREDLHKVGAGGTVVASALAAPGVASGSSEDDADAMFVHIDGVVTGTAGAFKIDVDLAGTKLELRGEGLDVDPDENRPTACIFVQSARSAGTWWTCRAGLCSRTIRRASVRSVTPRGQCRDLG
jgi:hypothetical protein